MQASRSLLLIAFVGCTAQAPAGSRSTPAAPADPCAAIAGRFRDALAAGGGRCEKDADCACYNPVIAEAGCGGATDRTTADKLGALETEFHAASCPWPHQCPAQQCAPRCEQGTCR